MCIKNRAQQNPIGTRKTSVKYWYTLGFGGKSFHLFITGGRIGQDPSRICDEKTPDANPDMNKHIMGGEYQVLWDIL